MSLKYRQKSLSRWLQISKNNFVDTNVSTNSLFLSLFGKFLFLFPKCFQLFKIRGLKIVTKNTMKSMVTTVFTSFLVTVLGSTPYENGPFLALLSRFGDYFDAMSEVVTIKNRTADFNFAVKENDRN